MPKDVFSPITSFLTNASMLYAPRERSKLWSIPFDAVEGPKISDTK